MYQKGNVTSICLHTYQRKRYFHILLGNCYNYVKFVKAICQLANYRIEDWFHLRLTFTFNHLPKVVKISRKMENFPNNSEKFWKFDLPFTLFEKISLRSLGKIPEISYSVSEMESTLVKNDKKYHFE